MASTSIPTPLHPLLTLSAEIFLSSAILGLTPPSSFLRPAAVPLLVLLVAATQTAGPVYLRAGWATFVAGQAFVTLLRFFDLAFISRLSYAASGWAAERGAGARASYRQIASEDVALAEDGVADEIFLSDPLGGEVRPSFSRNESKTYRLLQAFTLISSPRHLNTLQEVKNAPHFASKRTPTYSSFVFWRFVTLAVCTLYIDAVSLLNDTPNPHPDAAEGLFSKEIEHFFTHLFFPDPSFKSYGFGGFTFRILTTFLFWTVFIATISGFYAALSIIFVTVGHVLNPAPTGDLAIQWFGIASWRPLYGSLLVASSLRGWWGAFWHQTLRRVVNEPTDWFAGSVLKLPPGKVARRYVRLLLAFALSGLMHTLLEVAAGMPAKESGAARFFFTQAAGVMLEDAFSWWYWSGKSVMGDTEQGGAPAQPKKRLLWSLIGYLWVIMFLVWSTPAWMYSHARMKGEWTALPFSILRGLMRLFAI